MEAYFVLDERGEPRLEHDHEAWTRWSEQANCGIARTMIAPQITVLTTFSGVVDDVDDSGAPRLFHTRVFGGVLDGEEAQYATRPEALAGHTRVVEWCRLGSAPDGGVPAQHLAGPSPD